MDCERQAPLFMELSRQEYRSGLPFPSPGDLPDPEVKSQSLVTPALAGGFFTTVPPGKPIRSLVEGKLLSSFQQNVDFTNPSTKFDDAYNRLKLIIKGMPCDILR